MYGFRQFNDSDAGLINFYLSNPKLHISEIAEEFNKSGEQIYPVNDKFFKKTPRNVRCINTKGLSEG